MMNTCGTCKFIGPLVVINDDVDTRSSDDYCVPSGYHRCGLIDHLKTERKASIKPAVVVDGSGYYAALCVKEEFGCNQWQAKEST